MKAENVVPKLVPIPVDEDEHVCVAAIGALSMLVP
jgi:hypothetical protein